MRTLIFTALAAGCVLKDPVHPVYRYDLEEASLYGCPHAPAIVDERCLDRAPDPQMTR